MTSEEQTHDSDSQLPQAQTSEVANTGPAVGTGPERPAADAIEANVPVLGSESAERSTGGQAVCRNQYCFAPDTPCHLGDANLVDCDNWQAQGQSDVAVSVEGDRPPWSGLALGSVDVTAVAATRRARMVALVGAADAGKTSALAAYFIGLRRGHVTDGLGFAGSYTLLGWDQIAHHAEFPPTGSRGFPPHTTVGRSPALLHIRLGDRPGNFADVLFTDVPGEWFEEWAFEADGHPGAQWIADRADVFVLLSDAGALGGSERGSARSAYQALASRVASVAGGRAVYPVRAKADLEVPEAIEDALERTDTSYFGRSATPLSVIAGTKVRDALEPLDEIIRLATAPRPLTGQGVGRSSDPFLGFGHDRISA